MQLQESGGHPSKASHGSFSHDFFQRSLIWGQPASASQSWPWAHAATPPGVDAEAWRAPQWPQAFSFAFLHLLLRTQVSSGTFFCPSTPRWPRLDTCPPLFYLLFNGLQRQLVFIIVFISFCHKLVLNFHCKDCSLPEVSTVKVAQIHE